MAYFKNVIFAIMIKKVFLLAYWTLCVAFWAHAQINTEHVMHTGRTRLYFGNYSSAIENFNMIIRVKPHLPEPYFYRGAAKLNLEDYRGAKADLDKALEIKTFYPDAYLYRGMVHYNLGNYTDAMNDYSKAMELDGENADIYNNRGICKAAMRDVDGAIEDYSRAIELSPKSYNAHLNRSLAYQSKQEWDKAIEDCNQMIRIKPNSAMGYMSRGMIKIEKKDYAGALRDFDFAIYFDPNNAFAYHNRGLVKQQLESYEAAIHDYDQALALNPQMASAYFNRAISKEILERSDYQKDYDLASLLDERFAKRPWQTEQEREEQQKQMLAMYQQQQSNLGSNSPSLASQATVNDSLKSDENAINLDELRKRKLRANLVVADDREKPGTGKQAASIQDQTADIELLDQFLVTAILKRTVDSNNLGYFNLHIERLNAANNYDPYLTITNRNTNNSENESYFANQILAFNERIKQNPSVGANYMYRGMFRSLVNNDFNGALADFDHALKMDERNLIAYFLRATTRTQLVEAVLKVQQQSTQNQGLNQINSAFTGISLKNNLLVDDILTDYTAILYMNPEFVFAYYNRGNLYVKLEKYGQAIEEFSKAISLEPDFAEAYYNRGLVKILLNNIDGAAADLSRAGELGIEPAYNVIKRYCNK